MKRRARDKSKWWSGGLAAVDVGESLRLIPYWERERLRPGRHNIIIDPGPSFGAGDHPSTVMALELLESALAKTAGDAGAPGLLDAGTGTGVLAIAGKMLGAGLTVGFDIDGAAIYTARRNLELNGLTGSSRGGPNPVELFIGEVNSVGRTFHVVTANLAAPLLVRIAGDLAPLVRNCLILSGIAEEMGDMVEDAYRSEAMRIVSRRASGGWRALCFER